MSKRNFILLIIILGVIATIVLGYFYFYQPQSTPGGEGEGTNFLSKFNPFASNKTEPPSTETPVYNTEPTEPGEEPRDVNLKKISSMPVAGYGIFQKERFKEVPLTIPAATETTTPPKAPIKPTPPPTEFVAALRYVARSTGNIYQTFADKIDERKFSSTVIPKVYEAYFGSKAESVVMRYLKTDDRTIDTFVGKIPKEVLGADSSGENEIKGIFLPENIKDVSLSLDATKLFYLLEVGDSVVGTTYGLLDNKKVQVFDSPFTEWLSWWGNSKTITITTKPSAFTPGYVYTIDPINKKISRAFGGINGLTTLISPDGKLILYSGSDLVLKLYDIGAKSSSLTGVRTMPEKCVWNRISAVIFCAVPKQIVSGLYPDSWYKGQVSFSDQIWRIDVKTGNTQIIIDPIVIQNGQEVDGIKLGLDEKEDYLFFVNKKDSYLWQLKLN